MGIQGNIEDAIYRARLFLWWFGWGFIFALSGGIAALAVLALIGHQSAAWIGVGALTVGYAAAGVACWAGYRGRHVEAASDVLVGHLQCSVILLVMLFGPDFPLYAAFIIPLTLSLFVLPLWATFAVVGTSIGATALSIGVYAAMPAPVQLDRGLRTLFGLATWVLLISVVSMLVIALVRQVRRVAAIALGRAAALADALRDVQSGRAMLERAVVEVAAVVGQVNEAATAQDTATNVQGSAVTDAATSLTELSEAASEISSIATRVRDRASITFNVALAVQRNTARAVDATDEGQQAVAATIYGIEHVARHADTSAAQLLALIHRLQLVTDLLNGLSALADDVHVLGLNAGIESTVAGEQGDRFAVIAMEVTRIADTSGVLAKTARRTVAEIEATLAAVVLAADEGRKLSAAAVMLAERANERFGRLADVITDCTAQVALIVDAANAVHDSTLMIAAATQQQREASNRMVETMAVVGSASTDVAALTHRIVGASGTLYRLTRTLVEENEQNRERRETYAIERNAVFFAVAKKREVWHDIAPRRTR